MLVFSFTFIFPLLVDISSTALPATYYPDGYKGCYLDKEERILEHQFPDSTTNSGDECKGICREFRFRYAGTEHGKECFCGDTLKDYENKSDSECNTKCTGNTREYCGGEWRISIYDNWGTTTTQKLTTSVTVPTTFTNKTIQPISTTMLISNTGTGNKKFKGTGYHVMTLLLAVVITASH